MAKNLLYLSFSDYETTAKGGHSEYRIEKASDIFDEVFVICHGPKEQIEENGVNYHIGTYYDYLRYLIKLRNKIDYIFIFDYFIIGFLGAFFGKIYNIPIGMRCGGLWKYKRGNLKRFFAKLIKLITKPFVFKTAKKIVFNAEYLRNKFPKYSHKSEVVYNGVDNDLFKPKEVDNEKIEVIFVGRMVRSKGVKLLAEVSKDLKEEYNFTFIGDGDMKDTIEDNYPHIDCKGKLPHEEVSTHIRNSDILILPTYGKYEGFPNVLLEGMSCGKAVIGTDIAGIPEMIDHMDNGIIIQPKSKEDIKRALLEFKDSKVRKQMGENAREEVLENYSLDKNISKLYRTLFTDI